MRSATQPQNCRARKAQPSNTDSIAAPYCGVMPRSLQNAGTWCIGTAMGTQQQNTATISRIMSRLRGMPSTSPVACGRSVAPIAAADSSGGGCRKMTVSVTTATTVRIANATIVQRQPKASTPSCRIGGQIAPATAWPEEINATAAPRRRSNQRLT